MTKSNWHPWWRKVWGTRGTRPVAVTADAWYSSPRQMTAPRTAGIDFHVATGRVRTGASV